MLVVDVAEVVDVVEVGGLVTDVVDVDVDVEVDDEEVDEDVGPPAQAGTEKLKYQYGL